MPATRVVHWVPANHATRMPRRHVYIGVTGVREEIPGGTRQVFAEATVMADLENHRTRKIVTPEPFTFTNGRELWEYVGSLTEKDRRTILWTHNLAVALRLSDAFSLLPELGWSLVKVRIDTRDCSATWRRGGASLVMTDLHAWAQKSLADFGKLARLTPVPGTEASAPTTPDSHASTTACRIIASSARTINKWIVTEKLGNWAPTGAAMAWATWRHSHYTDKVLVHDNDDALAAEQQAVWAGRAEAWLHGRLPRREWSDLDMSTAYARISADVALPVRLLSEIRRPSVDEILKRHTYGAVLAELEVTTDVPVLPAKIEGRVLWPVGTFKTTVWDPEWRSALCAGANLTVKRAWVYRRAPALSSFARWALAVMKNPDENGGALIASVVKQMTRTLVGRFGVSYSDWEEFGEAFTPGIGIGKCRDADSGDVRRSLVVGTSMWTEGEKHLGENAFPAILGYVMSETRARLWDLMLTAGLEHVAYVDTDGLITDPVGRANLESHRPGTLRPKAVYRRVWVGGPRQLQLDGNLKAAGVPGSAVRVGDSRWAYDATEGLAEAIKAHRPGQVITKDRRVRVGGIDHRRIHLPDGTTQAREVVGDSFRIPLRDVG